MRILIIEDEQDIAHFVQSTLRAESFAVDVCMSAQQGLTMASCNDYDVIVLDNILPDGNGLDICRSLRNKGKQALILVLSALDSYEQKIALLDAGADDYMTKPFSVRELVARIRALLRRPQHIVSNILQVGHIQLDMQKHEVRQDGDLVTLTRKEFALLEYLMRNAGYAMTRSMIMEHVWEADLDPFSNTIEAHIRSLRKKLGDNTQSIIKTISGVGYKMTM